MVWLWRVWRAGCCTAAAAGDDDESAAHRLGPQRGRQRQWTVSSVSVQWCTDRALLNSRLVSQGSDGRSNAAAARARAAAAAASREVATLAATSKQHARLFCLRRLVCAHWQLAAAHAGAGPTQFTATRPLPYSVPTHPLAAHASRVPVPSPDTLLGSAVWHCDCIFLSVLSLPFTLLLILPFPRPLLPHYSPSPTAGFVSRFLPQLAPSCHGPVSPPGSLGAPVQRARASAHATHGSRSQRSASPCLSVRQPSTVRTAAKSLCVGQPRHADSSSSASLIYSFRLLTSVDRSSSLIVEPLDARPPPHPPPSHADIIWSRARLHALRTASYVESIR